VQRALAGFGPEQAEAATGVPRAAFAAAAKRLRDAKRPALVFGRGVVEHPQAPALLQAIENLGWASGVLDARRGRAMYVGPQSGAQGALDMGLTPDRLPGYVDPGDAAATEAFARQWQARLPAEPGLSAPEVLRAAAEGRVKALWIVGDEWLRSAPDRALAEKALAAAELVVVNELFPTQTARQAHVVFPVAAFAEKEGTVTNCERRLQRSARALSPRRGTRTDLDVFQAVARALGAAWSYRTAEDVFREIARLVPGHHGLSWATLLPLGPAWALEPPRAAAVAPVAHEAPPAGEGLWLLSGGTLFLQGSLSHRGTTLPKLAKRARAALHPAEGRRLGVAEGDAVELAGPAGTVRLPAVLDDAVPEGAVFVPCGYADVDLNRLGAPAGAGLRVRASRSGAPAPV
jgi:predicted molibdopterin-dependent oxidoreductase YjgC